MYQRLTETCPRQEAIRHDVEQLMNALRLLLVRLESLYWHNNEKSEYDTNITGSNDVSLWLNKDEIVSKNSSTLVMKKFIAAAMLNSKHVVSRSPELF